MMASLSALPKENALTPIFYVAGAMAGLASGLFELFANLFLLGFHMAIAHVTCADATKAQTQHCQQQRRQQEQEGRRTAPVAAAAAASAAPRGLAATTGDSGSISPAPPTTPKSVGALPHGPADDANKTAAVVTEVAPAAQLPMANANAEATPGSGDATETAGASAATDAGVPPRPTSSPVAAAPAVPADAPNGHDLPVDATEAAATVPNEQFPPLPQATHALSQPETPADLSPVSGGPGRGREVLSVSDSPPPANETQMYDAADLIPAPPLVLEPVPEVGVEQQQQLQSPAAPAAAVGAAAADDGPEGDGARSESGVTATSYAATNSADRATRAPLLSCLKAATATAAASSTPGPSSVAQRSEEKRHSSRRKGAHKSKPR